MNRRLLIRVGLVCASVCVLGWKLPGMLDGALSSIDEHKGTMSMLRGGSFPAAKGAADGSASGKLTVLGAASSLSPAERARLLEAARKQDPLAEAQAKAAARTPSVVKKDTERAPPPIAVPEFDPALLAAMRALGMDPESMDLKSVDIDALLAQARGDTPKD
jgi:hypothetical protein